MSLFRTAFVIGVAVALMPTDQAQQARLYEQAATAAHWTATFCDRNAATCTTASEVWATFVKKAEFGAKLTYDLAVHYAAQPNEGTGSYDNPSPQPAWTQPPLQQPTRGTLTPLDLQPAWRAAPVRQGA